MAGGDGWRPNKRREIKYHSKLGWKGGVKKLGRDSQILLVDTDSLSFLLAENWEARFRMDEWNSSVSIQIFLIIHQILLKSHLFSHPTMQITARTPIRDIYRVEHLSNIPTPTRHRVSTRYTQTIFKFIQNYPFCLRFPTENCSLSPRRAILQLFKPSCSSSHSHNNKPHSANDI